MIASCLLFALVGFALGIVWTCWRISRLLKNWPE